MDLRLIGLGLFVWVALTIYGDSKAVECAAEQECGAQSMEADCGQCGDADPCPAEHRQDETPAPVSTTYFAPLGGQNDGPHRLVRVPLVRTINAVVIEFLATRRLGRNCSGARLVRGLSLSRSFATTMQVVALPRQAHAPPSRV